MTCPHPPLQHWTQMRSVWERWTAGQRSFRSLYRLKKTTSQTWSSASERWSSLFETCRLMFYNSNICFADQSPFVKSNFNIQLVSLLRESWCSTVSHVYLVYLDLVWWIKMVEPWFNWNLDRKCILNPSTVSLQQIKPIFYTVVSLPSVRLLM